MLRLSLFYLRNSLLNSCFARFFCYYYRQRKDCDQEMDNGLFQEKQALANSKVSTVYLCFLLINVENEGDSFREILSFFVSLRIAFSVAVKLCSLAVTKQKHQKILFVSQKSVCIEFLSAGKIFLEGFYIVENLVWTRRFPGGGDSHIKTLKGDQSGRGSSVTSKRHLFKRNRLHYQPLFRSLRL